MATSPSIPTTYVTTHNIDGLSTFTTTTPRLLNAKVAILYSSPDSPVNFSDAADLTHHETSPLQLFPKTGSTTIVCEWPAGGKDATPSPIHRTLTLDIGVVTAGEVEIHLDSGEMKLLKAGDVLIHRGTMHSWRNPSDTEAARMVLVVLPSEDVTVGGKAVVGRAIGI